MAVVTELDMSSAEGPGRDTPRWRPHVGWLVVPVALVGASLTGAAAVPFPVVMGALALAAALLYPRL